MLDIVKIMGLGAEMNVVKHLLTIMWGKMTPAQKLAVICERGVNDQLDQTGGINWEQLLTALKKEQRPRQSFLNTLLTEFPELVTDEPIDAGDLIEFISGNMDQLRKEATGLLDIYDVPENLLEFIMPELIRDDSADDLAAFDAIEVHGMQYVRADEDVSRGAVEPCFGEVPDFYCVQGHLPSGGLETLAEFGQQTVAEAVAENYRGQLS